MDEISLLCENAQSQKKSHANNIYEIVHNQKALGHVNIALVQREQQKKKKQPATRVSTQNLECKFMLMPFHVHVSHS